MVREVDLGAFAAAREQGASVLDGRESSAILASVAILAD